MVMRLFIYTEGVKTAKLGHLENQSSLNPIDTLEFEGGVDEDCRSGQADQ